MSDEKLYFPLFVDLQEKQILIFGGGKIATRRILSLMDFGATLKVVAPECTKEIMERSLQGALIHEKRNYVEGEIGSPYLVLAATNDPHINEKIYQECKEKGILVNVASDQTRSDFFFPGLAVEEPIVVGITASGKDHQKAKRITDQIKDMLKSERRI